MDKKLQKKYGNRIRTRVCGVCTDEQNRILCVGMKGISDNLDSSTLFYAPVGGGVELMESATDALKREFREETGLMIEINSFMCVYEYLKAPIHAIELFFTVKPIAGELQIGTDPELLESEQIITDVRWITWEELKALPSSQRHGIFDYASSVEELKKLRSYIRKH